MNLPPGAQYDSNAPWFERTIEEAEWSDVKVFSMAFIDNDENEIGPVEIEYQERIWDNERQILITEPKDVPQDMDNRTQIEVVFYDLFKREGDYPFQFSYQ